MTSNNNDTKVSIPEINHNLSNYLPVGEEANMLIKWAKLVSNSPFYQSAGGEAGIVSMWLAAKELDIPPMAALNGGLYFVKGKVTLSATMMNALIRKQGHSVQKIEGNDRVCHLRGKRRDTGDTAESIFTMEQATKAGLTSNPVWKSYPQRMLFNRALTNLAKELFPDCINNLSIGDEIIDITPIENTEEDNSEKELLEAFKETHKLNNPKSEKMEFLKELASASNESIENVIKDAAKNEKKFIESFNNYKEMNTDKSE